VIVQIGRSPEKRSTEIIEVVLLATAQVPLV
jgi:hypothetical protein